MTTQTRSVRVFNILQNSNMRYLTTCFLSSVVMDGKNGNGLKLEKNGPIFQVLMLCLQKSPKIPNKIHLISSS